jgi:hypothetical protein
MNCFTTWILKRLAKKAEWNFPRDRELHQRRVLLAWHRIMHDALSSEAIDHSDVLREMSLDAHDKVWGHRL